MISLAHPISVKSTWNVFISCGVCNIVKTVAEARVNDPCTSVSMALLSTGANDMTRAGLGSRSRSRSRGQFMD